jgi:HSP20 family molecular chaperone IbpA
MEKRESDVTQVERSRAGRTYAPNVDIIEEKDKWLVVADVPGARAENIDIQYEQGQLTINASVPPRRQESETHYLVREYGIGDYHRCFRLGEGVDAGRIEADVSNGVLTVHLPKSEAVLPKKIAVKTG